VSWRPFIVALALPPVFAAVTLASVAANRGETRREVVLTDQDVILDAGSDRNSGARVWLSWSEPAASWIDCRRLQSIGFSCGVDPASPQADRYYARQLQRNAFVAFALDGTHPSRSRLVPVDADRDAGVLRRRYPDATHVVAPAVLDIARVAGPDGTARVTGVVVTIDPRGVQVPTTLRANLPRRRRSTAAPPLRVTIRWGRRWEPWIVAIDQ